MKLNSTHRIALLLLSFWFALPKVASHAQVIVPKAFIAKDSAYIGEPVVYTIVCKHNDSQELVFPTKEYKTKLFECISKVFYPTTSANGISTDSVVYTLRTFQTKPFVDVVIPIFLLKNNKMYEYRPKAKRLFVKNLYAPKTSLKQLDQKLSLLPMRPEIDWIKVLSIGFAIVFFTVLKLFTQKKA
jgi:hypothetical protein